MGRGKKKGAQPEEKKGGDSTLPEFSSLSLTSEGGPSTSTVTEPPAAEQPSKEATPVPEEDNESGLMGIEGGKSRRKKPKPKKPQSAGTASGVEPGVEPGYGRGQGRGQGRGIHPAQPIVPGTTPSGYPGPPSVGQTGPQYAGQPGPPASYAGPPAGYAGPPAGYAGPPAGYAGPPAGYAGPPTGYAGPPAGYAGPPAGYAGPPAGYAGPPAGYAGPPAGYAGPPAGYPGPPAGYARPPVGQPGPPVGQPRPPSAAPMPTSVGQPGPPPAGHPGQPQQPSRTQPPAQPQKAPSQALQKAGSPGYDPMKCRFSIPLKVPNSGKVQSRPQKLLTNYLDMKIRPNVKIYRYDVGFQPDRPKKAIPKAFKIAMNRHFPKITAAFDQMKNFYTIVPLPKVTTTDRLTDHVEVVDDNGKTMKFEVSFKATGVIELNTLIQYMKTGGTSLNPPTEAIQCVDVILRQGTLESYVKAGRTFFKRPSKPIILGDGLEMWTGLFQSAIFTSRPFVNIDVAHKGFPIQQPMIALLQSLRLDLRKDLRLQYGRGMETLRQFIKTLRVVATVGGDMSSRGQRREFICNDLAAPPGEIKFEAQDAQGRKRTTTVLDYFTREKGCRLQYPNLNCMWVGPRDKNIYYPMELLEVAYGQVRNRQLNEFQLRTMVTEAATPPGVRKQKIEEVIKDMNYSRNPQFKEFGLEIGEQFAAVPGRVMQPPRMQCGGNVPAEPRKGAWIANQLQQGATLTAWGLVGVGVDAGSCKAQNIIQMFQSVGQEMGMSVGPPQPAMTRFNLQPKDLKSCMEAGVANGLQMLVVIVSTNIKDTYSQVKKVAELHVGLLTQCIKDKTAAMRMNPQTVRNILLKVNSKLMGVNYSIHGTSLPACMKQPFMLVGADVTHPSPDQSNIPSIAAVTASIDKKGFKYNLELSIQAPKMEMIVEFKDMMVDHLKLFRAQLGVLPKEIYVFRDGVSEGQFAQVMNSELQAVYDAHAQLSGSAVKPKVLFMLVQKRHHTRFFLERSNFNVEPGTVVDQDIVHPSELDFYLVSHQAIKGTARPTRYHAVCNDPQMAGDEVEQLAYYLCHLYSRCTRSVSYPAPTYYAHLACMRARYLTLGNVYDNVDLERNPQRLHIMSQVKDNNPMFFV